MRKMWVNKSRWENEMSFRPGQYLNFYADSKHPHIELLIFTPAELEAHERRVWEAAREEQDIDDKHFEDKYCYFDDWEKEQEK